MYLSKRGFVIEKKTTTPELLNELKNNLVARPLRDTPEQTKEDSFKVYIETKNKLYIPKSYGISKFGIPETIQENYSGQDFEMCLEFKGTLKPEQMEPVNLVLQACKGTGGETGGGILSLNTGGGKCEGIDTPHIMYDGSIKLVQDLVVGDLLMGDDSKPRTVLSLARGQDLMYRLTDSDGESFVCNQEHILVLKNVNGNKSVFHHNKYYYWQNNVMYLSSHDTNSSQEYSEMSLKHYLTESQLFRNNFKPYRASISIGNLRERVIECRKAMNNFLETQEFTEREIYLLRSIGTRVIRTGKTVELPYGLQTNKYTFTEFVNIEFLGIGDYYGFTLDQNHRYLLGSFLVSHNTVSAINILSKLNKKTIVIVNKISLLDQWKNELKMFLPDAKIGILQGQAGLKLETKNFDVVLAMLQSMARIDYPAELFNPFGTVIVDECHNLSSKVFSQVFFKLCCKYTIGLSATPTRADGCDYVFKWHLGDIVYRSGSEQRKGLPVIIRQLKLSSEEYREYTGKGPGGKDTLQYPTMITNLLGVSPRNELITDIVRLLGSKKEQRRILVLSDRRTHVKLLYSTMTKDPEFENNCGLFLGAMTPEALATAKSKQIIFATVAAFSEGVSEKDLDTLVLCTPKKFTQEFSTAIKKDSGKMEQLVGRIFRKDHVLRNPVIVDLQDDFSLYRAQSAGRNAFYKKHFQNAIFVKQSVDLNLKEVFKFKEIPKEKYIEPAPKMDILSFCVL